MRAIAIGFVILACLTAPLVIAALWIEISGWFRDERIFQSPSTTELIARHQTSPYGVGVQGTVRELKDFR